LKGPPGAPALRGHPIRLGDLVRAVCALGLDDEGARAAADLLGLAAQGGDDELARREVAVVERRRPVPTEPEPPDRTADEPDAPAPPAGSPEDQGESWSRDEFVLEPLDPAPPTAIPWLSVPPLPPAPLPARARPREIEPLLVPAWMRNLLAALVATSRAAGAIDIDALVSRVSHGYPIDRIPRRVIASVRAGAQILVDRGESMMPYRRDADPLIARLEQVLGAERIQRWRFDGIPDLVFTSSKLRQRPYAPPPAGTPVVVLSDLGIRDLRELRVGRAAAWLAFARRVRAAGCPLVALAPYPARDWPPALARAIPIVSWDRATTVGDVRRALRRGRA
jgi:hypothetical protein